MTPPYKAQKRICFLMFLYSLLKRIHNRDILPAHFAQKCSHFFGNKMFPNAVLFSFCLLQLKHVTLDKDRQAPHMLSLNCLLGGGPGELAA